MMCYNHHIKSRVHRGKRLNRSEQNLLTGVCGIGSPIPHPPHSLQNQYLPAFEAVRLMGCSIANITGPVWISHLCGNGQTVCTDV